VFINSSQICSLDRLVNQGLSLFASTNRSAQVPKRLICLKDGLRQPIKLLLIQWNQFQELKREIAVDMVEKLSSLKTPKSLSGIETAAANIIGSRGDWTDFFQFAVGSKFAN